MPQVRIWMRHGPAGADPVTFCSRSAGIRLRWQAARARLAACLLLVLLAPLVATPSLAAQAVPAGRDAAPVRIFFITDVHSNEAALARVIADANRELPDLVLDGGDFVHDGTESEFRRSLEARAQLGPPWYVARGNHDALLRGPFSAAPPQIPAFRTLAIRDVRFILLDNASGVLGGVVMDRLTLELEANTGRPIVVVMHVPPLVERLTLAARLRHLVPFHVASPVMTDPAEVARFMDLMERHRVLAVLTGHTHSFEHSVRGAVHYIVAATAGGLTPGPGVAHEYLDIVIDDGDLVLRRVRIREPAGDPVTMVFRTFDFYRELNGRNHAMQGWNYTPSASVQLRTAAQRVEARGNHHAVVHVSVAFERLLGSVGRASLSTDAGLLAGRSTVAADISAAFRIRLAGDYNRSIYVGAGPAANAGFLAGRATAGIGAGFTAGVEWQAFTLELARSHATNHRATAIMVGRRY